MSLMEFGDLVAREHLFVVPNLVDSAIEVVDTTVAAVLPADVRWPATIVNDLLDADCFISDLLTVEVPADTTLVECNRNMMRSLGIV
jgi:hypothetical protein